MGVQIKIDGVKEVLKFIETKKRNIDKGITDGSIEGGNLLAEEVRQSALGNRAEPRSFKTGAFHDSITVETSMNEVVVFSDVEHACLIGANQSIYNPELRTSDRISTYKYDYVLSKDGKKHKVYNLFNKRNNNKNILSGIKIKIDNIRKPLFITEEHLILCLRKRKNNPLLNILKNKVVLN